MADRAARVRARLDVAVQELDAEIEQLEHDIKFAGERRAQFAKLAGLDHEVFEHLIAVLNLEGSQDA